MERRGWTLGVLLLLLPASPRALAAQARTETGHAPVPATAAARSLVVPGWGQLAIGQRRAFAYAAAEAILWAVWAERKGKGNDLRRAYRDLAWRSARQPSGLARLDGPWAYYETLSKWARSGAFDRDGALAGIQPEEDASTFNGSVWALARGLHFSGRTPSPSDPAWEAAVAWYGKRAYAEAFLWDWTGKGDDLVEFRQLIHRGDDRFRQATAALGAVLANHVLSATDAFLSARLRGAAEVRLATPPPGEPAVVWLTLSWTPRS